MRMVVALLCVAARVVLAQGAPREVTGIVRDTASRPMFHARVIVLGATTAALTDAQGRYRLCDLRTSRVTLRVVMIGRKAVQDDSIVLRDSVTTVDFLLEPIAVIIDTFRFEPNTGRRPQNPKDSAMPIPDGRPPTCRRP